MSRDGSHSFADPGDFIYFVSWIIYIYYFFPIPSSREVTECDLHVIHNLDLREYHKFIKSLNSADFRLHVAISSMFLGDFS